MGFAPGRVARPEPSELHVVPPLPKQSLVPLRSLESSVSQQQLLYLKCFLLGGEKRQRLLPLSALIQRLY